MWGSFSGGSKFGPGNVNDVFSKARISKQQM